MDASGGGAVDASDTGAVDASGGAADALVDTVDASGDGAVDAFVDAADALDGAADAFIDAGDGFDAAVDASGDGAVNSDAALPDAGPEPLPCTGLELEPGVCKATFEGVYAVKLQLDVWWRDEVNAAHLIEPGRGLIDLYFRAEISASTDPDACDDGSRLGKLRPCGGVFPPFLMGVNCTALQMQFPAELWDDPSIPDYDTTVGVAGFEPGALLSIAQTAALLGIELSEASATFPTYQETTSLACADGKTGRDCYPDHDGDGKPGVTARFATSGEITMTSTPYAAPYICNVIAPNWTISEPPTQVLGGALPSPDQSISEAYLGLRLASGASGVAAGSCHSGAGDAVSDAVLPLRTVDCMKASGQVCSGADTMFLDSNMPLYHVLQKGEAPPAEWKHPTREAEVGASLDRSPSVGPRSAIVRLGDLGSAFQCGGVRAASFSAL